MAETQGAGSRALFTVIVPAAGSRIAAAVGSELSSQNAADLATDLNQVLMRHWTQDQRRRKSREKHDAESQAIGDNARRLAAALRGSGLAAHSHRQILAAVLLPPHEATMLSGADLRDGAPLQQSSDIVDRFVDALTVLEANDLVLRRSRSGGNGQAPTRSAFEWLISDALPPLAQKHLEIEFHIDRASRYVKFVSAVLKEAGILSPRVRGGIRAHYTPAGIETALRRLMEKEE